jgi:hypothetical protein
VKRGLYWGATVLGVLLLVGGSVLAVVGFADTAGPAGVVRGYFAAVSRGDAPRALALGHVPDGPHTLLTSEVLRAQQRVAPLRRVRIEAVHRSGDRARVTVRYVLDFPRHPQAVGASVGVHRANGDWRLDAVAVRASLDIAAALDRATIVGAGIPDGETLLFPGAVPVTFDTPFLQLDPASSHVDFGADPVVRVEVQVSRRGRDTALGALAASLDACLAGSGDLTCPLPSERFVPGSIRGRVAEPLAKAVRVTLRPAGAGVLDVAGDVAVDASSYQRLSFNNRARPGSGRVVLKLHARAYATAPLHLVWLGS